MAPAVQLPLFFSNSITPFNLPNFAAMEAPSQEKLSFDLFKSSVLRDFKLACLSREISQLGRKEVLSGKAKFGIFGDGKEIAQVAMLNSLSRVISEVVITGIKLLYWLQS